MDDADDFENDNDPLEGNRRKSFAQTTTPRRTSFTQMAHDGSGEEEVAAMANRSKAKGKAKAVNGHQEDDGMEDEIAQGLDEVGMDQGEGEEDEPEPEPEPKKKKKANENKAKRPRRNPAPTLPSMSFFMFLIQAMPLNNSMYPTFQASPDGNADGVRRGKRMRYAPLEWWRQEKVVYGRRESGVSFVPTIKAIVRIPKEPPRPLGIQGKRKRSAPRSKSKTAEEDEPVMVYNPEEGWDDETEVNGVVTDWVTRETVQRRV